MSVGPRYGVDQFQCRAGLLFAYGWLFYEQATVACLSIVFSLKTGEQETEHQIDVHDWRQRVDVAEHFEAFHERALQSGWLVYARLPDGQITAAALLVKSEHGHACRLPVPWQQEESRAQEAQPRASVSARWRLMALRARKVAALLGTGQWRELWRKTARHFKGIPLTAVSGLEDLQRMLSIAPHATRWVLFVDHDLGGGANKYRQERTAQLLAQGYGVMTLTTQINILSDVLVLDVPGHQQRVRLHDMRPVFDWIERLGVVKIIYNNAVSLPHPLDVMQAMVQARFRSGVNLEFCVHDFFAVCPSQHLIDFRGVYCDIPEASACHQCLARNKRSFVPVYAGVAIDQWREIWLQAMLASDEVRVFSESSRRLLIKAFPMLAKAGQVKVVPHAVAGASMDLKPIVQNAVLHVGVVGHINHEKGSRIVKDMVQHIEAGGIEARVSLLGSIDVPVSARCFNDTGPYSSGELHEKLLSLGVNICLVPSVCPETFSYVSQELIRLGMPVVCFDVGAPPERVAPYRYGHVLASRPSDDIQSIWDEITLFYDRLYS